MLSQALSNAACRRGSGPHCRQWHRDAHDQAVRRSQVRKYRAIPRTMRRRIDQSTLRIARSFLAVDMGEASGSDHISSDETCGKCMNRLTMVLHPNVGVWRPARISSSPRADHSKFGECRRDVQCSGCASIRRQGYLALAPPGERRGCGFGNWIRKASPCLFASIRSVAPKPEVRRLAGLESAPSANGWLGFGVICQT
jgi:hypothetical protein